MKKSINKKLSARLDNNSPAQSAAKLVADIRSLINTARTQVAQAANAGLVLLNWHIGKRIREDILGQERAEYGKKIVETVSRQLSVEYGRGFSRDALFRMVQFAEQFTSVEIVGALSRQLGWSHFVELLPIRDHLKRDFYAEMCRIERWSVRTLEKKIGSMLFERTALSKKPAKLAKQELTALREENRLSPDLVFRDPYFLDFLGLKGVHSEKDLESAILRELEHFLIEFGTDFTFVARQKRMMVGHNDFYLDLLFYHRRLRCLVAIELKLGKFKPSDMGQMELYLRWLEKNDMRPGENPPIGLILCAQKDHEEIELLKLDERGIHVSEYMTELPPRKDLEKKLHAAVNLAQKHLENQKQPPKK